MKCLSIMQPWATFVVDGIKTVENRSKATNYRGELLIHASLKFDTSDFAENFIDEFVNFSDEAFDHQNNELPGLNSYGHKKTGQYDDNAVFHMGAIIGKVNLVDCIPNPLFGKSIRGLADLVTQSRLAKLKIPKGRLVPSEWFIGNSQYLWIVTDAVRFAKPIPYKGKLNIFEVEDEVVAEALAAR